VASSRDGLCSVSGTAESRRSARRPSRRPPRHEATAIACGGICRGLYCVSLARMQRTTERPRGFRSASSLHPPRERQQPSNAMAAKKTFGTLWVVACAVGCGAGLALGGLPGCVVGLALVIIGSLWSIIELRHLRATKLTRRFRRDFNGRWLLVCSRRGQWGQFIDNNVLKVLPDGCKLCGATADPRTRILHQRSGLWSGEHRRKTLSGPLRVSPAGDLPATREARGVESHHKARRVRIVIGEKRSPRVREGA